MGIIFHLEPFDGRCMITRFDLPHGRRLSLFCAPHSGGVVSRIETVHTHFLLSDVFLFHLRLHKAKEEGEQKTGG